VAVRGEESGYDGDDEMSVVSVVTVTVTVTICGDACPLSYASAEAYKLAKCTRPQGWGS